MGVGGQRHALAALPLGKRHGNHCIGGWVGNRAGLDGCGKSRPPPGFDPRTVLPVASRYMDRANEAHASQKDRQTEKTKKICPSCINNSAVHYFAIDSHWHDHTNTYFQHAMHSTCPDRDATRAVDIPVLLVPLPELQTLFGTSFSVPLRAAEKTSGKASWTERTNNQLHLHPPPQPRRPRPSSSF